MRESDFDIMELLSQRIDKGSYSLPTIPEASLRLMNLLSDSDSNLEELEKTVAMDPILASQILKIANSCISGAIVEVTSLKNALMRLGRKHVRSLVMMLSIKSSLIQGKSFLGPMKKIWAYSITCAFLGKYLAKKIKADPEEFFVIGLLHATGKLILLSLLHEMLQLSRQEVSEEFLEKIYSSHDLQITQKLLTSWKISPKITQIITLQSKQIADIEKTNLSQGEQKCVVSLIFVKSLCLLDAQIPPKLEELQPCLSFLGLEKSFLDELLLQKNKITEEVLPFV